MGDGAKATAEIEVAVGLDPASATIWNNAGVIHWRSDRRSAAEHAYRQALQLEPAHIGALANLVEMYRASGEVRQSERYQTRLRRAQISDPFSQFQMAQESMDLGAYARAISHYRRAIRLLPNQPMFHHSLADAYRKIGRESAAQRSIRRALSLERARFSQQSIPVTTAGSGSE
jgi:Flp pilus assembly protein TadD